MERLHYRFGKKVKCSKQVLRKQYWQKEKQRVEDALLSLRTKTPTNTKKKPKTSE